MAKRKKKQKKVWETLRNWNAVAAHFRTGGGAHGDRRTKRKRTRAAQKQTVLNEY